MTCWPFYQRLRKSLIFQLLIMMARRNCNATTALTPVILAVTLLVSIIYDRIMEVEAMGLKGLTLNNALDNFKSLEEVDIIYALAENVIYQGFLTFLKKGNMFCKRVDKLLKL